MKAPLSWLKEYVDIELTPAELADKLLNSGFEVEEIVYLGNDIENVITGKIIDIKKHFNAEKLSVCMVDVSSEILTIVTGASNIKVGDVVPVALTDAKLPGGKVIKPGDLRGIMSYGMLCSGSELNIDNAVIDGAETDGILILPADTETGIDIKELLGLNEIIFDIGITANRADCQSITGIAREIAAITGKKFRMPKLAFKESEDDIAEYVSVDIKEPELCSRYMARAITNIKLEPSPKWMRDRLRLAGIRAINNIVDITNYVLTEIGQPMHAFDSDYVKNKKIIVRLAGNGEKITALDGKEYSLKDNMLVIADDKEAVGIAGVMGGEYSGVLNTTKTVIFESARFARDSIRHTGRALGLRSASSARFEKGVDVLSVETGMNRALALITQLKAAKIVKGVVDINHANTTNKTITTTPEAINSILGIEIPRNTIIKILNSLEIKTEFKDGKLISVLPLYREDIDNFSDLCEEVIRVYGYGHIDGVLLENSCITPGAKSKRQKMIDELKNTMCASGAYEINTYSFVPEKYTALLNLKDSGSIRIRNPLSEDYAVMRTTMLYNMLTAISTNLSRKNADVSLFEIGRTYHAKNLPLTELPDEITRLCCGLTGGGHDFFTLKNIVEKIFDLFGAEFELKRSAAQYLHPGISADIYFDNKLIGSFGEVHPIVADNFSITQKTYVLELNIDVLSENDKEIVFAPLPKFPSVSRDLAIIIDEGIAAGEVSGAISKVSPLISSVELFDVYQGGQIEKGHKSLAYSIKLQADKTLQDTEINECMTEILRMLNTVYKAKLR